MDAFVKRLFPNSSEPIVCLGELDVGMVNHTYANGYLKVEEAAGFIGQKPITFSQPMTLLGLSAGNLYGGFYNCFSGLCKDYFTPDGLLNPSLLCKTLPSYEYLQIQSFPWNDNHVSLIVNCIRYFLIRHAFEQNPNPVSQSWPDFNDGVVNVDRNQWWPAEYPSVSKWTRSEWPGGNDANNYPSFKKAPEGPPTAPDSRCFIDLRGLSMEEARFIVLMLGVWNRRSRMLLDFELPKLAESVVYRTDENVECVIDWDSMPPALSADEAWSAMKRYVARNRLYNHFSVALHVVISVMYQMLPVTAQGQIWLSLERLVKLPKFYSVRGRHTILSEGEAGLIRSRSVNEWAYLITCGGSVEKIHLIAMVFAQAVQTGLAVRAIRVATEICPCLEIEKYNRFGEVRQPASEAVGFEVPDSGMINAYVIIQERCVEYKKEQLINITSNHDLAGLNKYTTVQGPNNTLQLEVPWFVLPGIPTLLMPINPFPTNSPLALKGEIKADEEAFLVRGHRVKADMAWEIANLCHMCGYSLALGHMGFHVPADVAMMWPLYFDPHLKGQMVNLIKMTEKEVVKIELPPMCNEYFRNFVLKYEVNIYKRGVGNRLTVKMDEALRFLSL